MEEQKKEVKEEFCVSDYVADKINGLTIKLNDIKLKAQTNTLFPSKPKRTKKEWFVLIIQSLVVIYGLFFILKDGFGILKILQNGVLYGIILFIAYEIYKLICCYLKV